MGLGPSAFVSLSPLTSVLLPSSFAEFLLTECPQQGSRRVPHDAMTGEEFRGGELARWLPGVEERQLGLEARG